MDDFDENNPLMGNDDDRNDDDDDRSFSNPMYSPSRRYPHDSGEIEMTSTLHRRGEKSTTTETSFMSLNPKTLQQQDKAWETVKAKFSRASAIDLKADYSKTGRLEVSKFGKKSILYSLGIEQLEKNK